MLGPVICQVACAWSPVETKLFLCHPAPQPVKSHVHWLGSLWLHLVVDHSICCWIISLHTGGWLWVSRLLYVGCFWCIQLLWHWWIVPLTQTLLTKTSQLWLSVPCYGCCHCWVHWRQSTKAELPQISLLKREVSVPRLSSVDASEGPFWSTFFGHTKIARGTLFLHFDHQRLPTFS